VNKISNIFIDYISVKTKFHNKASECTDLIHM